MTEDDGSVLTENAGETARPEEGDGNQTESEDEDSDSNRLESINTRNIGKWTVEAVLADRVVGVVDQTYKRAKQATTSFLTENDGEYIDLAEATDYPGTKFRIIPFDGTHPMWTEEIQKREVPGDALKGPPRNLPELIARNELPRVTVDTMSISWSKEPWNSRKDERIHTERDTSCLKVILPNRGRFWAKGKRDGKEGELWADHRDGSKWDIQYAGDQQATEPRRWYIPVPRSGEIDGTRISWYD